MSREHLAVVGAGPVGAVLALAAAQRGFRVTLIEADQAVDENPRAATIHPSTLEMLDVVGLADEVVRLGLVARYFDHWDRPTRALTARLDHQLLADVTRFPFVVQLEQHKLVERALERLAEFGDADVRRGTRALDLRQDAAGVTLLVEEAGVETELQADVVIGTDGARSTVRKALGIEFEGYTWPERFLVLTTAFDFEAEFGCSYRNYFSDPEEWVNLFKVPGEEPGGRWRAVFPAPTGQEDDEALSDDAVRERLARLSLHGNPADQLLHRKSYRVHQRVAASFRDRRVFLAGDAAHANNPIGGLGLNCGIHDATEFVRALADVSAGASPGLLDAYAERRKTLNVEFVQQQTIANKKRLEESDPVKRASAQEAMAALAADPERARAFLLRTSLLESVDKSRALV
ncbi:FAD-dependent monooxygenase [Herbiconiux sp. CPCC 205763]|uniref:FAD-dependent monooxygenase n=1 Tax=Herbiconiux aconitum TaxID=2970913 RepID=A0ABT2GSQ7_9MICO|nr:FAD-dependent monooxygenase [Herbiconiux aconitum]MCS5719259.1 FAD-dependent monooxygenase [Herbiconiux aconitum]